MELPKSGAGDKKANTNLIMNPPYLSSNIWALYSIAIILSHAREVGSPANPLSPSGPDNPTHRELKELFKLGYWTEPVKDGSWKKWANNPRYHDPPLD